MSPRPRILVVEDEPQTRGAVERLLRERDYAVETAADGVAALEKLEEQVPDLLLTDLRLPDIDGFELIRQARARDPGCVAVVMTEAAGLDSAVTAMRVGAADYLAKPFDGAELAAVVERSVARRRSRGNPSASPIVPGASLAELERWAILETLAHTGGSTARTAKILGISRRKVQYRLSEYLPSSK